jgi:hypothetical protein
MRASPRPVAIWILLAVTALASGEDPVAALGPVQLPFDRTCGYLPALLKALDIPIESQIAVFSKTSIQSLRIEPANPRVLYFNDSVTVGWVRGGFIELAAQDPRQGLQFYVLQQRPDERIVHRNDCVNCHKSGATLMRSVIPAPDGVPSGEIDTDSRTPFDKLWGGWYVTGTSVPAVHLGNAVFANSERRAITPALDSDIVALTVFAHQMRMMNLLAHPDNVNELVDHLLFLDEAPLPGPLQGHSAYAQKFSDAGPRDHRGRSLRQFDLNTRLMRYRCSYMIYSAAFDALPSATKNAVYRRMWTILSGGAASPLSRADRNAVVEILRDTMPDLPAYFVSW